MSHTTKSRTEDINLLDLNLNLGGVSDRHYWSCRVNYVAIFYVNYDCGRGDLSTFPIYSLTYFMNCIKNHLIHKLFKVNKIDSRETLPCKDVYPERQKTMFRTRKGFYLLLLSSALIFQVNHWEDILLKPEEIVIFKQSSIILPFRTGIYE